jgi:hypothetical protein
LVYTQLFPFSKPKRFNCINSEFVVEFPCEKLENYYGKKKNKSNNSQTDSAKRKEIIGPLG